MNLSKQDKSIKFLEDNIGNFGVLGLDTEFLDMKSKVRSRIGKIIAQLDFIKIKMGVHEKLC